MGLPVDATTLLFLSDQRAAAAAQKTLQQRQMWALQDASATSAATRRAATSTSTLQLLQLQEAQQQRRLQEQLYGSSVVAPAPRFGNTSAAALLQRLQDEQLMQQQQQQLLAAEGEYERQNQLAQLLASARGSGASSAVSGVDANLLLRRRLQELEYERRAGVGTATISPTSSSASLSQRLTSYSSKASAASGVASMPVHAAGRNDMMAPWSSTSAGLLGNLALEKGSNHSDPLLGRTKKFQKKPKDQPTRALSAYNIFFKEERQRLLARLPGRSEDAAAADASADVPADATAEAAAAAEPESRSKRKKNPHGKISFEGLAKAIGRKWQSLGPTDVAYYKQKSEDDKKRYRDEMDAYVSKKRQAIVLESSASSDVATTAGGSEQDPIAISEGSASKRCKLE